MKEQVEVSEQHQNEINQLKIKIEQLQTSIASDSSNTNDIQKTLTKEKARTKWLSRENSRFAQKIKDLTNHIATLEKDLESKSSQENQNNEEAPMISSNSLSKSDINNTEITSDDTQPLIVVEKDGQ